MRWLFVKLSTKHKNNKFIYYLKSYSRQFLPNILFEKKLPKELKKIARFNHDYIQWRVDYYNKLTEGTLLNSDTPALYNLRLKKKFKVYYFDSQEYARFFPKHLKANFLFGDIRDVPKQATFLKSRPLVDNNENSVLLKLNKVRHFTYTNDKKPFETKKNMLVGRGGVTRPHRIRFFEIYFNHPLCNIGQTNCWGKNEHWIKEYMTIDEQLDYKFILCLEGNDVASNLKWVMSSNSLAVMPKPKFETWFMEGTLIPDVHYVCIKDDYSDLEERMLYYINNTHKALEIIHHANKYVQQFKNKEQEDLISLLVMKKYFKATGQL